MESSGRKVVALDLDGTILQYNGSFVKGELGKPYPGAIDFVNKLLDDGARVIIFTARAREEWDDINSYLFSEGVRGPLTVTSEKLREIDVFVDDRALSVNPAAFPGGPNYESVYNRVKFFKEWWKK